MLKNLNRGISTPLAIGIILVAAVVIGGAALAANYYWLSAPQNPELIIKPPEQRPCTQEAKICPDGTAVGRVGPNCEFAPCPEDAKTAGWKTYSNDQYGFEIKYPNDYGLSKSESAPYFDYSWQKLTGFYYQDEWADSNISVFADNRSKNVSKCLINESYDNGKPLAVKKNIGGVDWYVVAEKIGDAAMGGERGLNTEYRILRNGYCYRLAGFVHWRIVGYSGIINDGKSSATEEETRAQKASIDSQEKTVEDIIATFRFVK